MRPGVQAPGHEAAAMPPPRTTRPAASVATAGGRRGRAAGGTWRERGCTASRRGPRTGPPSCPAAPARPWPSTQYSAYESASARNPRRPRPPRRSSRSRYPAGAKRSGRRHPRRRARSPRGRSRCRTPVGSGRRGQRSASAPDMRSTADAARPQAKRLLARSLIVSPQAPEPERQVRDENAERHQRRGAHRQPGGRRSDAWLAGGGHRAVAILEGRVSRGRPGSVTRRPFTDVTKSARSLSWR